MRAPSDRQTAQYKMAMEFLAEQIPEAAHALVVVKCEPWTSVKFMNDPKRHKILYAEDDQDNQIMVATLLKLSDIEVFCAPTVEESWQLAQIEKFDLYMLDSRFPDGDGIDLCRKLRKHDPLTPIVFLSGDAQPTHREMALEAGANDYLTKPFFDDLGEAILRTIYKYK